MAYIKSSRQPADSLAITFTSCTDPDSDGRFCQDNCTDTFNPDRLDSDGDGAGNLCDSCPLDVDADIDGDGFCADLDNCAVLSNPGQDDTDGDGLGDAWLR